MWYEGMDSKTRILLHITIGIVALLTVSFTACTDTSQVTALPPGTDQQGMPVGQTTGPTPVPNNSQVVRATTEAGSLSPTPVPRPMTSPEIRVSTTNPQAEGQKSATETPTLRVPQPSTATDREALVALYRATNGAEWPDHRHGGPTNLNWLTDRPLGEWYGVTTDHNGRVIGLELSNVGVKGSVPPEIGNLSELRQLSMWGYGLTGPIPPELSRLTKLTELRLGRLA